VSLRLTRESGYGSGYGVGYESGYELETSIVALIAVFETS
jgi:hypothetical protein